MEFSFLEFLYLCPSISSIVHTKYEDMKMGLHDSCLVLRHLGRRDIVTYKSKWHIERSTKKFVHLPIPLLLWLLPTITDTRWCGVDSASLNVRVLQCPMQ